MRQIISGRDAEVAAWMCERLPELQLPTPYVALGVTDSDGKLVGAVLFDNFVRFNIDANIALASPLAFTRIFLLEVFRYPFEQLKCPRITAKVCARNFRSRRLCEHLGFKLEGICREAWPDGSDLYVYGMLKRECRWLNVRRPRGQKLAATGT